MGFRKPLVMTSGLRGSGLVEQLMGSLKWHGIEAVLYDQVESNPKDYNVMDSVAMYQENEVRQLHLHRRRVQPRRL